MRAVRKAGSATARACAVFEIAGFWLLLLSGSGCSDPGSDPGSDLGASRAGEGDPPSAPARLTDLSSSLRPTTTSPGSVAAGSDPRASEDGPACQDTCMSKRAECGKVCGEDCGQCPNGEDCQDGKCVCTSSCDGTLCADACGQPCACATGTACDVSGRCVPAGDCSGLLCTPSPEFVDAPVLPGPGDPVPAQR
jgi:hypothetical protein